MHRQEVAGPPKRYLIELTPQLGGFHDIRALTERSRDAAEELAQAGCRVRFLRSVFVPEDGSCFLLFEAPSADQARLAADRAQIAFTGIDEVLTTATDELPSGHGDVPEEERGS